VAIDLARELFEWGLDFELAHGVTTPSGGTATGGCDHLLHHQPGLARDQ
jgi:hypothetical protein